MNIFYSALLGLIQGLTEFIPVSSSGHLVIAQSLIPGFSQPGVLFDVVLHFGTLFAVVLYFRKKILSIRANYLLLILVGTIPAALAGFFLDDWFESLFLGGKWVALALIVTGILNIIVDLIPKTQGEMKIKNAFLTGIFQAISIIPGVSRSGATIFSGVSQAVDRKKAAEFSFLLSIPAIAGASILQVSKYGFEIRENPAFYATGFLVSVLVGFFSIGLVYKFLLARRFKIFGVYAILLGLGFLVIH